MLAQVRLDSLRLHFTVKCYLITFLNSWYRFCSTRGLVIYKFLKVTQIAVPSGPDFHVRPPARKMISRKICFRKMTAYRTSVVKGLLSWSFWSRIESPGHPTRLDGGIFAELKYSAGTKKRPRNNKLPKSTLKHRTISYR